MEKKKPEFHTITLRLAAVLLVLVMLTTAMVSGRFARYASSASGSDNSRVARFHVTQSIRQGGVDLTQTIPLPEIKPGETVTLTVLVEHDTEVAVCNTIQVVNEYNNLPLTISVKEKGTAGSGSASFTAEYGPGTFTKEYEAAISWVAGSNDTAYIGMVDMLTVTVTSTQVD